MESHAAVLHEPATEFSRTGPAAIETIEVEEPTGEEVLVEIVAASLCHTDVSTAVGDTDEPKPLVMGHEGAGIVREVGERVTSVQPGDHVVIGRIACGRCKRCRQGRSNLCEARTRANGTLRTGHRRFRGNDGTPYYHYHGASTFTEYTNVTEEVAIPITDQIPLEQATLLGCGIFTGVGAVVNTANIEPGSSVAIFGVGGVGLSAIQAADLRGAKDVIAIDVQPEKLDTATQLGATHTIDAASEDPVERVHELTEEGAQYAFDMVGDASVVEQAFSTLSPTGTAVLVGTPPDQLDSLGINLRDVVRYERTITGSFNGSYNLPIAIPMLADLVARNQLSLEAMITSTSPLESVNEAMENLETGSEIRQVILP